MLQAGGNGSSVYGDVPEQLCLDTGDWWQAGPEWVQTEGFPADWGWAGRDRGLESFCLGPWLLLGVTGKPQGADSCEGLVLMAGRRAGPEKS